MVTFRLSQSVWQFAKSLPMRASVVYVPTCQTRAHFSFLHANMPINVSTRQRCANYSTWRANMPKVSQFFNLTCQRPKRHANFSFWRANVPLFWTFLLQNAKGNSCTLILYKKFYIILDIIVIYTYNMYMYRI